MAKSKKPKHIAVAGNIGAGKTTSKVRIEQEEAGGLAFRIMDTGAVGGLFVTPIGLQEGARKVAAATNIRLVRLNADATPQQFVLEFLGNLFVRPASGEMKFEGWPPTVVCSQEGDTATEVPTNTP